MTKCMNLSLLLTWYATAAPRIFLIIVVLLVVMTVSDVSASWIFVYVMFREILKVMDLSFGFFLSFLYVFSWRVSFEFCRGI